MSTADPRPLRILVVDDHEDSAHALAAVLRRRGHDVFTASGFVVALDVAAGLTTIDLLVSDITLPDGSGCDLLPVLRTRQAGGVTTATAIAVTGHAEPEWLDRCRRSGYGQILVKPGPFDTLLGAIEA
jgi:two-component system, chemotaxis family, CheB/CheR fusion protein